MIIVIDLGLIIGLLIVAVYWIRLAIEAWNQSRCKHDGGVNETQACDAICKKCGKNLGFIGTWRNKQNGQQTKTT